jgi:uncharacterized protein (DUF983 family)
MNATTTEKTEKTETRKAKGFKVVCPYCGDAEATVGLNLANLRECECRSCGETYSPAEAARKAREMAEQWERVVRWVEMAQDA